MADGTRIGVLGLSHDHVWDNLRALAELGEGRLAAAADPRPELREKARGLGCERLFDDPAALLEETELDAVWVFSNNRESAELATLAARRGLHVMIEKPLAADLAGAARLYGAARESGVQLMVNWPFAWSPALRHALALVAEGRIGEVFQVNYRAAHGGPRELGCSPAFAGWLYDPELNGAGALMDYCSYGAALVCLLLGLPSRVNCTSGRLRKPDLPAEDNAVLVMQHAAAISVATASWTQIGHLTSYEPMLYGSEGSLVVRLGGGELWLADREHDAGVRLDVPEPPAEERSSAAFFLAHVRSGEPITGLCGPEVGLATQHVLEGALLSAAEGLAVPLPLPVEHLR